MFLKNSINNYKTICALCGGDSYNNIGNYKGTTYPFNNRGSRLLHCPTCDLVYMEPTPSELDLKNFYQNYWNSETSVQSSNFDSLQVYKAQSMARVDLFLAKGELDGKSILDYGAGHAFIEEAVRIRGVRDYKYSAVEADIKIVQNLKDRGINAATRIDAFGDTKYDIVVAFHILEHLADPVKLIEVLIRHLNPGGFLFIEVPNKDYLWKNSCEPHVIFFSEKSMTALLNKVHIIDFDILSCGRSLKILAKERSFFKRQKHFVGRRLRACGLKWSHASQGKSIMSEKIARRLYEMDEYGEEREWLRVIARSH